MSQTTEQPAAAVEPPRKLLAVADPNCKWCGGSGVTWPRMATCGCITLVPILPNIECV